MRFRHSVVAIALVIAGAANVQAAIINFDDVANQTIINAQYAALGVTFACSDGNFPGSCSNEAVPDGANVYARTSFTNNSSPNVVSPLQSGVPGNRVDVTGVIQANFTVAVNAVSIDAFEQDLPEGFDPDGVAFLSAFDALNNFIVADTTTTFEAWETLTVSAPNIAYVRFSSTQGTSHAYFDNLRTNEDAILGPGGPGPTPVPEPASMTLLGTGVLGLIARARRRRANRA